ncbi:MAG: orotidine-5'-phosphate decarboxylase [Bacteroidia bacterium]|nr:orotidine-5'-phosphate decarboxylase [Bacteroidia bacterium]
MKRIDLVHTIKQKGNFLCVGLDSDLTKIPDHLRNDPNPILRFNKAIIDATHPYCVSYKINTAFYEALGADGWKIMEETLNYIPKTHFTIADAKRGDIGNTSNMYAKAFFETLSFDAVTLAPYMGKDSIAPFFEYPGKWGIVLALTSNPGSADYEQRTLDNKPLFEHVIQTTASFTTPENAMFVIGATKATELAQIRTVIPNHFLLVPGVGAQGGSLEDVAKYGMNADCGLLINASRSIIYASSGIDFAEKAALEAKTMAQEMASLLSLYAG